MAQDFKGIGKKERSQIAQLLKANLPIINAREASRILNIDQLRASQLLSLWAKKGWLARIKQGTYIPISLQSENSDIMADEPWVIATALYPPCYIGGWSAAEYWDFTEQIFSSTMIFTTKKLNFKEKNLSGTKFTVKTITKDKFFGTKSIWVQNHQVEISDPTKTIADAFDDLSVVGGIRMAIDLLNSYLSTQHKDLDKLFIYSIKMKNSAILKRLGFVVSKYHPKEKKFIQSCHENIKSGYSQLDPAVKGKKLITAWNLWVPKMWENSNDNN